MAEANAISVPEIKAARAENPKMRDRDLADKLGISEAQLVAADVGETVTRITADMDRIMPALGRFGDWLVLGGMVVVPVFILLRLLNYRRG